MHSSRMRTVRFNGHLYRGVSSGVCVQEGLCLEGVRGFVYLGANSRANSIHPQTQRQTPPRSKADTPWTQR